MPIYEYMCDACGPFEGIRPMAESGAPLDCPGCGVPAPRAILTAPRLAGMASDRRRAIETNERSVHAPRLSTADSRAERAARGGHVHGPGCGCGSGKGKGRTVRGNDGAKSFPSARPWMISH